MRLAAPIRTALLAVTLATAAGSRPALAQNAAPCSEEANRHFDFWEGRWVVRAANGALAGHNTLSVLLGECVLQEHYTTPSGYEGMSLNAYDATRGVWHQTWMDLRTRVLELRQRVATPLEEP